jgi:oligopeptide transport system ATP-binding protein
MNNPAQFLEVKDLKTHFPIYAGLLVQRLKGTVKAVDGVNLTLRKGEILGLVGESGCGKSTLGRSIMQLVKVTDGVIRLDGQDLVGLTPGELRRKRLDFQMIFQDPYASLNPRLTVFDILSEPLLTHKLCPKDEVPARVADLMERVGLAQRFIRKYPHEFSGGQRQRIAIARALATNPQLIIADEPVSALDVSIQSQIINLLLKLSKELNLTMIFISHDLSVIKYISDRVAVMYLGKIVEQGTPEEIFAEPKHPYTRALLSAIPVPDPAKERTRQRILLQGDPPSPINPPSGCTFHPRCQYAVDACKTTSPELRAAAGKNATGDSNRLVACLRLGEI